MIEANSLTKSFGRRVAVDDLSFTVRPGKVTGFLGPNGAGKSTTMRMLLGLDRPDSGSARINGLSYQDRRGPLHDVGALLDARSWHQGRTPYNHLLWMTQTQNLPRHRIDTVLELVGLTDVARRRAGGFSLGMAQRLNIAAAMLGDPAFLILDEPVNGLDPSGVRWIRDLMKQLAAEGRTVLVSSHLMNEMAVTADHLIIIARGRLMADQSMADFLATRAPSSVLVRCERSDQLLGVLSAQGATVRRTSADTLVVTGMKAAQVAEAASAVPLVISELTPQNGSLEDAFIELTAENAEYEGTSLPAGAPHEESSLR